MNMSRRTSSALGFRDWFAGSDDGHETDRERSISRPSSTPNKQQSPGLDALVHAASPKEQDEDDLPIAMRLRVKSSAMSAIDESRPLSQMMLHSRTGLTTPMSMAQDSNGQGEEDEDDRPIALRTKNPIMDPDDGAMIFYGDNFAPILKTHF